MSLTTCPHCGYGAHVCHVPPMKTYTRSDIERSLNRAANLIADLHDGEENGDTIAQDSTIDLAVNAAGYLLDHPDAGLDEIIPACYADVEIGKDDLDDDDEAEDDELEEVPEKGSKRWGELVTAKVLGWLA